ncbi:MAG: 1-phosphofructokinase [Candidatus Omnitrophica bacterium]|nr:1-phosphofructokinase [Candidatus Omnitrophota bacterium]
MKNYILTVTLNPAIDKTIRIRGFRAGHDHRFKDIYYSAGGKGINVSRALQKLKVDTVATGFVGGPSGKYIKVTLSDENIPYDFVDIKDDTRTSLTIIDSKTRQLTRVLEQGPGVSPGDIAAFRKKFLKLLKRCQYVIFSGRNIPGTGNDFYYELILLAHHYNKKAVLDTSGEPLIKGLEARPYLIKPNLHEAEYALQQKLNTRAEIKRAVQSFLDMGVENVIISLGKKGVIASDGGGSFLASPPVKKTVNTVGCGDALVGGFVYARIKGYSFKKSVQFGVATGTANSLNMQPGYFTRIKVARLAREVKVVKI